MTRTDSLPEEDFVEDRAVGYLKQNGKLLPNTGTLPWRGTAAGGGYSTVRDLEAFAQALVSGTLLRIETLAEGTSVHRNNYGFGL
jgi:D-alanyl-D-alanine carboxypeptidase